jgi:hypothetical protein
MPEAWLRGPVEGVPVELMPAAHSLVDAVEEIEAAISGLHTAALWVRPGGAASIGFHLRHSAGSIRRLLTYARGESLSAEALAAMAREGAPGTPPDHAETLLTQLRAAVGMALETYRGVDVADMDQLRTVGRARLPTTIRGLFFHLAEHTRRHAGQIVTTAKIIQGLDLATKGE